VADEEIKETTAATETVASEETKIKKGKKRVDVQGIACVNASFNNTIVSITDARGNVVAWGSPETPDLRVLVKAHHLQLSLLQKQLVAKHLILACVK
jgi:hypothetical protein